MKIQLLFSKKKEVILHTFLESSIEILTCIMYITLELKGY